MVDAPQSFELPEWLNEALRFGVVIIGGLYVVGLLIINIHLSRYGIVTVNLARPEYVMAGALWALLSFGFVVLTEIIWNRKDRSFVIPSVLLAIILFLALWWVSYERVWWRNWQTPLVSYASLFLTARVLVISYRSFGDIGHGRWSRINLFEVSPRGFSRFFALVELAAALSVYSWFVYPHLSREFGGGHKPLVKIVVPDPSVAPPMLPYELEDPGVFIGPVKLVFESESMFFVSRANPSRAISPWSWSILDGEYTVGIKKELVQAVLYSHNEVEY